MPSRRPGRKRCKLCGVLREDCGHISYRGLCLDCSTSLNEQSILQMSRHSGPIFDKWRDNMARSVGGIIPGREDIE